MLKPSQNAVPKNRCGVRWVRDMVCKKRSHDGASCRDAEHDGNSPDHPFPMKSSIAVADEPEGLTQAEQEEAGNEDRCGSCVDSADGIGQDHGKCGSASDRTHREQHASNDSVQPRQAISQRRSELQGHKTNEQKTCRGMHVREARLGREPGVQILQCRCPRIHRRRAQGNHSPHCSGRSNQAEQNHR